MDSGAQLHLALELMSNTVEITLAVTQDIKELNFTLGINFK